MKEQKTFSLPNFAFPHTIFRVELLELIFWKSSALVPASLLAQNHDASCTHQEVSWWSSSWLANHVSYVALKVAPRSEGPWKQTSFSGLTCKACLDLSILGSRLLCMEQALQAAETSFWLSNLFIMIIKSLVFNCVNCEPHELTCP